MEKNKKISQLDTAYEFKDADFVPIVQDEVNKKISKQTLFKEYYNEDEVDHLLEELQKLIGKDTGNIKIALADLADELRKGKADKAKTLAGYGITDAYTKQEADGRFVHPTDMNLTNYYNKSETYDKSYIDKNLITRAVTDLVNYYTKSETYTKDEVNKMVDAIPKFAITVVDELPTKNISVSTIYLLRNQETGKDDNIFTEYIYSNNNWEVLGQQRIEMDNYYDKNEINDMFAHIQLDDYYTKEEIDQMLINIDLSDYYNKVEIDTKFTDLDAEVDEKLKHIDLTNYYKKTEVDKIIVTSENDIIDITKIIFEDEDFIPTLQ